MVFLIGGMILLAVFGATMSTNLGGSLWQFDYEITKLKLNGQIVGADDYPSDIPNNILRDVTFSRQFDGMDVRTAYEWWVDPDGQPIFNGYTWSGLLPDIGVTVSQPWRTDSNGNKIDYDDEVDVARTWTDGDTKHTQYLYYYAFNVLTKTKQDTFIVPAIIAWQSVEMGVMEVEADITVQMRKSIFNDVDGEFMSAKVLSVLVGDMQLDSGLTWRVAPKVVVRQDINQALPITDRVDEEDYYNCNLKLLCDLTPGAAQSGLNLMPYEVWCSKTVMVEMMLTDHLLIGEGGDEQDPLDPPPFTGFDWAGYLLIIIVLVVIAIIAIAIIKMAPAIAALGLIKR